MARILVIDDSLMMQRLVQRMLEPFGHDVVVWLPASLSEIPAHMEELQPDLVITDLVMPGLDGLNVTRMFQRKADDLPIVVLTAHQDPKQKERLLNAGVCRVLYKPIHQEALVEAVNAALA